MTIYFSDGSEQKTGYRWELIDSYEDTSTTSAFSWDKYISSSGEKKVKIVYSIKAVNDSTDTLYLSINNLAVTYTTYNYLNTKSDTNGFYLGFNQRTNSGYNGEIIIEHVGSYYYARGSTSADDLPLLSGYVGDDSGNDIIRVKLYTNGSGGYATGKAWLYKWIDD